MSAERSDVHWMQLALRLAAFAATRAEVPVGAVIVRDGRLISTGFNLRESLHDPSAHAEMIAIREAARRLQGWRLANCTLYVTLEPCPMCAGLLHQCRIGRVVFGANDPKAGALGSLYSLHADQRLNHQYPITAGVCASECSEILQRFFRARRN